MEKSMNKKELLKLVESLNLPKDEYYILGGGSLVMFGIKETTSDLDLCVSEELFGKLKEKYNLKEENKNECGFYQISDIIEIIPNPKEDFTAEEIDGYKVEELNRILNFKNKRNAPKDRPYIDKITQYLEEHKNKINSQLKEHIEQIITYHYNLNDKGHGVEHAEYVINRSMDFASQIENINYEMVYVIAAYHDVAHHIDAKNHETISAKMLREDEKLKEFFTDEQIKIMSEAVEDHRSSMETEPRSIYGRIVSSADRNTSVEVTLGRCYFYNRRHFPELNEEEVIDECRKFLLKKFGINGYARSKMYFDDKDYKKYLDDITELASNSEKFSEEIKRINKMNYL